MAGLRGLWTLPPSRRERVIVWPKAYECVWSKAQPVLEALQLAWDRIRPCTLHLLAMNADVYPWFKALPEEIRAQCRFSRQRVPRAEVFQLLSKARVLLAPSLVDGIPNSLYEAMACGALPIVSPLVTIKTAVEAERNVLFARNLYPQEIAEALVRAMSDDALADAAVERNLELVARLADRARIGPAVADYYRRLAS